MPTDRFVAALNEQIANEFAASQQYIGAAVHYDSETLPRLAGFFYRQAAEEPLAVRPVRAVPPGRVQPLPALGPGPPAE